MSTPPLSLTSLELLSGTSLSPESSDDGSRTSEETNGRDEKEDPELSPVKGNNTANCKYKGKTNSMSSEQDNLGPPPDGGLEAWSCIASAFLLLFCVFGFGTSSTDSSPS
jgi:hypothetical protein